MPYLVVASITVQVQNGKGGRLPNTQVGTSTRAFSGNLRSTWRASKRAWQFQTELMSAADFATLEAAVALGAHVTCSGDAIATAGSVTCEVTVQGTTDEVAGVDGMMRSVSLLLQEV